MFRYENFRASVRRNASASAVTAAGWDDFYLATLVLHTWQKITATNKTNKGHAYFSAASKTDGVKKFMEIFVFF